MSGDSAGRKARVAAIDHVQLAMPPGQEDKARAFYEGLLGIPEVKKPANLAKRGGCWFERSALKVHLGVEDDFRANRKAHPAFLVENLVGLAVVLKAAGHPAKNDEPLDGYERVYVDDPFGNRIELMEPVGNRRAADVGAGLTAVEADTTMPPPHDPFDEL